jgi:hypothetical protein
MVRQAHHDLTTLTLSLPKGDRLTMIIRTGSFELFYKGYAAQIRTEMCLPWR